MNVKLGTLRHNSILWLLLVNSGNDGRIFPRAPLGNEFQRGIFYRGTQPPRYQTVSFKW